MSDLSSRLRAYAEGLRTGDLNEFDSTMFALIEAADRLEQQDIECDLVRRLLADHQRVEPHHADTCTLCREATAAIEGQPAQEPDAMTPIRAHIGGGKTTAYGPTGWKLAQWDRELSPAEIASYLESPMQMMTGYAAQTAQGERQPDLWVPVHESLAPVDADLLLTLSTGKVVVGMWHSNFGWDWADTGDVADEEAHVTHWRLFPMAAVNA